MNRSRRVLRQDHVAELRQRMYAACNRLPKLRAITVAANWGYWFARRPCLHNNPYSGPGRAIKDAGDYEVPTVWKHIPKPLIMTNDKRKR